MYRDFLPPQFLKGDPQVISPNKTTNFRDANPRTFNLRRERVGLIRCFLPAKGVRKSKGCPPAIVNCFAVAHGNGAAESIAPSIFGAFPNPDTARLGFDAACRRRRRRFDLFPPNEWRLSERVKKINGGWHSMLKIDPGGDPVLSAKRSTTKKNWMNGIAA